MAERVPPRLRTIVALAESLGWTYDLTASRHPRLTAPLGVIDPRTGKQAGVVTFSSTTGDNMADRRPIAHLRLCGVPIPNKCYTPPKRLRASAA